MSNSDQAEGIVDQAIGYVKDTVVRGDRLFFSPSFFLPCFLPLPLLIRTSL